MDPFFFQNPKQTMKHTYILLIILLILSHFECNLSVSDGETQSLNYQISYNANPECHLLVQLQFEGYSSGKTRMIIPHEWAWQDSYEKGIKNLKLLSPDGQLTLADNGIDYEISHPAGQTIIIQYEVKPYWEGPINREVYYRPIIKPGYFHFIGHGVFVYPDWNPSVTRQIRVEWKGIPDDWQMANSFGKNEREQFLNHSINELCHSVYMAGDFLIQEADIAGFPVYIALRGEWKFPQDELPVLVEKVVYAVRGFWNDYDFPYFLISMIPIDNQNLKGGTGLTNSFALFVSDDHENLDDLRFLLTHELFHTWNGRKIQREEPEELIYWFSEGFTNYYTRLILLRNGLITLQEFISSYNQTLIEYFCSPAINATNEEVLSQAHKDRFIDRMPYLRGDILAFRWNTLIKQTSSHSLDDLIFDLFQEAQTSRMVVSMDNLAMLMKRLVPEGVEQDMERYLVRGETLVPGANDLGPGAVVNDVVTYLFDLGFTFEESDSPKNWLVTEINENSPVWKAGLRKGYTITGRSIHWEQADQPIILVFINDQGKKTRIEYLPRGEKKMVPQYQLNEEFFQKNRAACLKWFGVTGNER
jgi:predicted metalloprotease with PDZ domain